VSAQLAFARAEFHDASEPDVSWFGPKPSE
jgi:hypothetical protein